MADNKRIVLAYSGGLDTSVAISYLKERTGKDVVAVSSTSARAAKALRPSSSAPSPAEPSNPTWSTPVTSSPTNIA